MNPYILYEPETLLRIISPLRLVWVAHLHWSRSAAFGLETVEEVYLGILMLLILHPKP